MRLRLVARRDACMLSLPLTHFEVQVPGGVSGQAQTSGQAGMTQQASSQQQSAEQAGTLSGVQALKTKGDGEETAVPPGNRGQSYGNLSQEVKPHFEDFLTCLFCKLLSEHKV